MPEGVVALIFVFLVVLALLWIILPFIVLSMDLKLRKQTRLFEYRKIASIPIDALIRKGYH